MEGTQDMFSVAVGSYLPMLAVLGIAAVLALWAAWSLTYGVTRGTLAALCRVGWLMPLVLCFFPESTSSPLPRSMTLKPLHVLIDDSQSMQPNPDGDDAGTAPLTIADDLQAAIDEECQRYGCMPKITRLSEQDRDVAQGYTPLGAVLDAWLFKVGSDPWILVSDGADSQPSERWRGSLKGLGRPDGPGREPRGLIVGFAPRAASNVWIASYDVPPFSFEGRPLSLDVTLKRRPAEGTERVQLQVVAGDQPLATVNAEFAAGEAETTVAATVPPLPRGQHLLTLRALPTAAETTLWDNAVHAQVEVMPNTVGVLHLLGSPSWDGRFLRRYLKGEPKYDLISFFILRDPWDSQQVSERELSLIPFPVERLFREELPNFRVVIIQNFTLFQFLLPEYQNNLVKFVQDGGGLLFLGGPRALQPADLSSSPLRAILPFDPGADLGASVSPLDDMDAFEDDMSGAPKPVSDRGPAYDPNVEFTVELAEPDSSQRSLANVYEDWESLAEPLGTWKSARGLHHMERVAFKKEATTPLLNAKVGNKKIPLAVASYPGKGRAVWLFTDSLWRLAMTPGGETSRQVYNRFMHAAMTWLMRQDLRKPLVVKHFTLRGGQKQTSGWRVTIQGPAARYFQPGGDWRLTVCGALAQPEQLVVMKSGTDEWEISGPLPARLAGGQRCSLDIEGQHPAFGSVKAGITGVFPEIYKDTELDAAPQRLEELAQITGARLLLPPAEPKTALIDWIGQAAGGDGLALPSRFKTLREFFWVLDTWWFWLLMALMPLEVLIRRADQIFALGKQVR